MRCRRMSPVCRVCLGCPPAASSAACTPLPPSCGEGSTHRAMTRAGCSATPAHGSLTAPPCSASNTAASASCSAACNATCTGTRNGAPCAAGSAAGRSTSRSRAMCVATGSSTVGRWPTCRTASTSTSASRGPPTCCNCAGFAWQWARGRRLGRLGRPRRRRHAQRARAALRAHRRRCLRLPSEALRLCGDAVCDR